MSVAKKILMVGDDPFILQLLETVPSPAPFEIENARDSSHCLAQVQDKPFDLVVTDPQTTGAQDLELLRQIRQIRPSAKVVVLSSESAPHEIIEALRQHAFSYFTRPLDCDAFISIVADALGLSAWSDGIEVLSARPEWVALRLRCQKLTADRLLQFMREMKMDLPVGERENIASAFREMLMNAIEHGAGFDPDQKIDICYVRTSRMIVYQIRDPGEGFRFDCLPHAAISNPSDSPIQHLAYREDHGIRPGGFGIFIARKFVDELLYSEKGNEVLLIKYLDSEQQAI